MPAVSLNQRSGALLALGVLAGVFLGSVRFLFVLLAGATAIFWLPQRLLSERELLGARFKLLSVGAGS